MLCTFMSRILQKVYNPVYNCNIAHEIYYIIQHETSANAPTVQYLSLVYKIY